MIALLLLSLALAMDAFAVSLVRGAARAPRIGEAATVAGAFGIAQGAMPLLGWGLGVAFAAWFAAIDHWIAFVLLGVLGLRMIRAALADDAPGAGADAGFAWGLLVAAIATSIDAAAAGITLPLLGPPIWLACAVIGGVTAILCFVGYLAGAKAGGKVGKRAELLGGAVLIALGCKILVEHLSA